MKKDIYIYHVRLSTVKNKNGTVTELTEINYLSDKIDTTNEFGMANKKCYKVGNFVDSLKKYIMQKVQADFDVVQTDDGEKHKIMAINGIQLQSR